MPLPQTSAHSPKYRPDLDGLRSLAIIPVVLYHLGLGLFPGGFVGVDVFFVISGFLITSLLYGDIEAGDFSILRFYERRVRRILPALFFMLLICAVAAFFILLPRDLKEFGGSLAATVSFVSNIYFWAQSGYFDTAAEFKPLLHTWSLAVEEQFYILFPPALWLLRRLSKPRLRLVLLFVLIASFLLSIWASVSAADRAATADFFLPVTRAWELLIGSMLALGAVPPLKNSVARHAISIAGLALILGSALLIDAAAPFPGWIAIFPCLGAAFVIYVSLSGGGIGNSVLAIPPLVFIGLISYPLYLWHWPVFVFANYVSANGLNTPERLAVLAAAIALATFSWRHVERPFRLRVSHFTRQRLFRYAGAGGLVLLLAGGGMFVAQGFPSRVSAEVLRYETVEPRAFMDCLRRGSTDVHNDRLCRIGARNVNPPSFMIWGDSHARRLAVLVDNIAARHGVSGYLAGYTFCPPLFGVHWPRPDCDRYDSEIEASVQRNHIHTVILHALWAAYSSGIKFERGDVWHAPRYLTDDRSAEHSVQENQRVFARALERTVRTLLAKGVHVVIVGPVPEVGVDVPKGLARAARYGSSKDLGVSRAQYEERQKIVLAALHKLSALPGVTVVYPADVLCARAACAVERNGQPLYIDDNHLSRAGLEQIRPLLAGIFGPD